MVPHDSGEVPTTPELFYVHGGATRHLRVCPHLQVTDADRILAAHGEVPERLPVCQWSQAEIDGVGRTYHPSFDAALEAFGAPVENRPRMREIAAGETYDRIWTPNSMTYVALGSGAAGVAVAWFLKGIVYTGAGPEELAVARSTSRATAGTADEPRGLPCPSCFMVLPNSGLCGCGE
ncbi:hypothetical protein ACFP63_11630 [Oerskovia jenensis]|uniref:Uncharacterized protein n=1 Tax=Oerskovia jenensis TaxID=162169 RepID=A0ABS2LKC1_9CELL|nr:hypothetical protein [Oerskovia jenensis]MBM7480802.1 hypothetical protein [Oerskovia jenensis]